MDQMEVERYKVKTADKALSFSKMMMRKAKQQTWRNIIICVLVLLAACFVVYLMKEVHVDTDNSFVEIFIYLIVACCFFAIRYLFHGLKTIWIYNKVLHENLLEKKSPEELIKFWNDLVDQTPEVCKILASMDL